MDVLDEEILNLWKMLDHFQVKYLMVGGFATNLHGHVRMTADMDIWIQNTITNRKNFRKALKESGLGDLDTIESMEFVAGWTTLYLNSGLELDIMTDLKGFPGERFNECYELAPTAYIHEVPVKFLHLNHLLEAKKASGRPKDLLDIEELKKLNNRKD